MSEEKTMIDANASIRCAAKNLRRKENFRYALVFEGVIIGLITGLVISLFRTLLVFADGQRNRLVSYAHTGVGPAVVTALVLLVLVLVVGAILLMEPDATGSGIPQVEAELLGKKDMNWLRIIVAKILGCALAIGGGLALGREGPSIQIGAMIGKGFARTRNCLLTEERILMSCGAGAGLSSAFGAPLAGAIFCLEELHRNFSSEVLLSALSASVVADFVAANIVGLEPVFGFEITTTLPLKHYWAVVILGILLGLFGTVYNKMIDTMQNVFDGIAKTVNSLFLHILNPAHHRIDPTTGEFTYQRYVATFSKLGAAFVLSYICFFAYPITLGSGNDLVSEIVNGQFALRALAVLLIVKFVFSTASFGSGAPGGIFLPLLVLGSITGGAFSELLSNLLGLDSQYIQTFVVLAMAGFFAAIVQAPVTGVVLITEMTGDFTTLLPLVAVSLIAYVVAELCGAQPIYTQLMNRGKGNRYATSSTRKSIISDEIHHGSWMDGKPVLAMGMPLGTLIVSVIRDGEEIIPDGHTILRGGDELQILLCESDIEAVDEILNRRCKKVARGRMGHRKSKESERKD